MMDRRKLLKSGSLGLLLMVLAACGSTSGESGGSNSPPPAQKGSITGFSADHAVIEIGEPATFTWSVKNPNGLSCSLDVDGDGVAEKFYSTCPQQGSFTNYLYPKAGSYTAKLTLGPSTAPDDSATWDLQVEAKPLTLFYYRLNVIKDCDAGLAGAGEFGWMLFINGMRVSYIDKNNAIPINDGEAVDLTTYHKSLNITDLAQTVSFNGTIYEYDNGSQIEAPFSASFDHSQNWGINTPGRYWIKHFTISSTCEFELSVGVRSP